MLFVFVFIFFFCVGFVVVLVSSFWMVFFVWIHATRNAPPKLCHFRVIFISSQQQLPDSSQANGRVNRMCGLFGRDLGWVKRCGWEPSIGLDEQTQFKTQKNELKLFFLTRTRLAFAEVISRRSRWICQFFFLIFFLFRQLAKWNRLGWKLEIILLCGRSLERFCWISLRDSFSARDFWSQKWIKLFCISCFFLWKFWNFVLDFIVEEWW